MLTARVIVEYLDQHGRSARETTLSLGEPEAVANYVGICVTAGAACIVPTRLGASLESMLRATPVGNPREMRVRIAQLRIVSAAGAVAA